MDDAKLHSHLFDEFPPVSTREWEDRIRHDLKGSDEKLLWRTREGLNIRPYYRSEDLLPLSHLAPRASRVELRSAWTIQQNLSSGDLVEAAESVRQAVEGGVECVGLEMQIDDGMVSGVPIETHRDLAALLSAVSLPEVGVHLDAGPHSPALFAMLQHEADSRGLGRESLRGSLGYDPLAHLAGTGELADRAFEIAAELIAGNTAPLFRPLRADVNVYHEAGADIVQETALALATLSEYFVQIAACDGSPGEISGSLYLSLPVSTSYFHEIAKLRAIRLLVPQVVRRFIDDDRVHGIPVHATTSLRELTLYDPASNLLRATTQAASAVIGGCDVLVVRPFDGAMVEPGSFALRLARNIQHILRFEAQLDAVNDPSSGSYYIEALTDAVARKAWSAFQEIERQGGLLACLTSGSVREMLDESRNVLENDVALRRRVLVGTNTYPDPTETRMDEVGDHRGVRWARGISPGPARAPRTTGAAGSGDTDALRSHFAEGGTIGDVSFTRRKVAEPVRRFRESDAIERLRLSTERISPPPRVLILPVGDPAVRSRRAQFARNFLGCGGFDAEISAGFDTFEEAAVARVEGVDILVLAAPDELFDLDVLHHATVRNTALCTGIVSTVRVDNEVDFTLNNSADMVRIFQLLLKRLDRKASET